MEAIKVRLTLIDGLLGTAPLNEEIYRDFIGSKAPDAATVEEEVAALGADAVIEKGMTGFLRDAQGRPVLRAYHIKGFFKDACSMLARIGGKDPETGKKMKAGNVSSGLKAYKKIIDGMIFPAPDFIPVEFSGEIGLCQRPLRANGPQGERTALAISEEVPPGATLTFSVVCLDGDHIAAVREWLDYGALRGLGQWRNSGKGRFTWEELPAD